MVKASTIARTAVLALALINQALQVLGKPVIPIKDEQLQELITLLITIIASVVSWWKNNSFTEAACRADALMEELKRG